MSSIIKTLLAVTLSSNNPELNKEISEMIEEFLNAKLLDEGSPSVDLVVQSEVVERIPYVFENDEKAQEVITNNREQFFGFWYDLDTVHKDEVRLDGVGGAEELDAYSYLLRKHPK